MLNKLTGLGFLALLLCIPLQADHGHRRSRHHRGDHGRNGYIEIHVGTPHGYASFGRGFRSDGPRYRRYDGDYDRRGRGFKKFKHKHRRYFKQHRHYHYDGHCRY